MKNIIRLVMMFFWVYIFASCIKEKDTEIEQPIISLLSPKPCDTLYFGESFHYTLKITDNKGLGNVSMDLHHNFGHHNHGSHVGCVMDAVKDAVHPYANSWIFSLPSDRKEFVFDQIINLPKLKNDSTKYDFGDYHFHIYVTDNDGYQVFTSLDIKIFNK